MRLDQLENIRVVLAEPDANLRRQLKTILVEAGMKNVLDTDDISQVRRAIDEDMVELIIGDTAIEGGGFNKLIADMRHREIGENPFVMAITMVDQPSVDSIRKAINSGTDHILAKPIDSDALVSLIVNLTHTRKRFVVTTDYIGPDRRTKERPGTMAIPQIDVPNPLRQRMTGQMRETTLRRTIETAWLKINEQKVERHAFQIGWLLDRIVPEVGMANVERSEEFPIHVKRLIDVSGDMAKRISKTRFAHVKEMTMTMSNLVNESIRNGFKPDDVRLMLKLSELISESFNADRFNEDGTQARDHRAYMVDKEKKTVTA
ncbi:MAG: response regulator [Rhodospirillaceae bacterium]|nr:response regulator [Rhodospirillaceae bacterium]